MSNQFNVVKFYETFARIIAEREGVDVKVAVRPKNKHILLFPANKTNHTTGGVRCRRTRKVNQRSA